MARKTHIASSFLLIAVMTLAGCSNDKNSQSEKTTQQVNTNAEQEEFTGKVPNFSGPYAAEFADAYRKTQSDLAHEVLADEQITESEYAEIQQTNQVCLEGLGFKDVTHNPEGGMSFYPPDPNMSGDEVDELSDTCLRKSGLPYVEMLRSAISTNPNNEDWEQLNVDCLIREGVVEPGFTKADLDQWYENDDPRLLTGGEADKCTTDPLGLLNN